MARRALIKNKIPTGTDINYQVAWSPQEGPQTHLLKCPVHEVFFGGARGGGKTEGLLGVWLDHAARYGKDAHGIIFRRRFKQLEEVLKRASDIFPKLGAIYQVSTATWTFPNGATLKLRHLWDERDCEEYHGHQYTFLAFDELTNWPTIGPLNKMRATLRSAAGVPPIIRLTGNPGGPGHNWVKQRYVNPNRLGYKIISDPDSGLERVFIPSRLEQNKILMDNDPQYALRIRQSGSVALVKAWLEGDWDIVAGGFFDDVFNAARHVIPRFVVPREWEYYIGFDWGFSRPSSLGIFARVTNSDPRDGDKLPRRFPRGSLIRVAEWYTIGYDTRAKDIRPNVGQRMSNDELGIGIASRLKFLPRRPTVSVADPAIFVEQGGPSPYDTLRYGAKKEGYHLHFTKADNNRVAGWQKMRRLLGESALDVPEAPGMWIVEDCEHWLRTVPVLQADEKDPDDVDTDNEDHAADDTRYVCMAQRRQARVIKLTGY